MPKIIHNLVNKLLKNKEFYPELSQEERESRAWGTATNIEKKKKKKPPEK